MKRLEECWVVLLLMGTQVVTAAAQEAVEPALMEPWRQVDVLLSAGITSIHHQNNRCITGKYLTPGAEVRIGGQWFLGTGAEAFIPFLAVDSCEVVSPPEFLSDGGVIVRGDDRLDFGGLGSQLSIAGGYRTGSPFGADAPELRTEFKAAVGLVNGHDNFESRWLPGMKLSAAVAGNRWQVVLDRRWFSTPNWKHRYGPGEWDHSQSFRRPEDAETVLNWRNGWSFGVAFRF